MTSSESYDDLRNRLLQENLLYEDEEFPADDSSIGIEGNYVWKRPNEICQSFNPDTQPEFIVQTNSLNLEQGKIGNCWVIVACACLLKNNAIFNKVVPRDQDFTEEKYCGAFQFKIWRYGHWETVIVDDRLPTENDKLVFAHSKTENEFWGSLLEKAYAKVFKKYKALNGGDVADALTDFTGGFVELYRLQNPNDDIPDIYNVLNSCLVKKGLAVATVEIGSTQITLRCGLVTRHAYNITNIKKVTVNNEEVTLVRLRNPWGTIEWNGRWNDESGELDTLSEDQKHAMGPRIEDGEFWMELSDFRQYFKLLAICHLLNNDITDNLCDDQEWSTKLIEHSWTADNSLQSHIYQARPGFRYGSPIDLDRWDNDTLTVIELMQKNRREQDKDILPVSFKVFSRLCDEESVSESEKCPSPDHVLPVEGMLRTSGTLVRQRSILDKFNFHRSASYVLVPYSTDHQDLEGEFIIRVFCKALTTY